MLIVQKFGGSSLEGREGLYRAAEKIAAKAALGNQVAAVVSAQGGTTDRLAAAAKEVNPHGSLRELDACLSAGEQMSSSLLAMALENLGFEAVSLTGWQAGLLTDQVHGNARVLDLVGNRVRRELDSGKIVLVAGFQGIDAHGDITTLGRGGSDTTAVALAGFLQADLCQIYTDVEGVYDKDPRKFRDAVKYDRISYEQMHRLIAQGAQVLHDRSVELAQRFHMPIEVLSSFTKTPGTIVFSP